MDVRHIPILCEAIATAGHDSRRRARSIRDDDYRTHTYESAWDAMTLLADCLTMDRFGSNTLNDRFLANDPGAHGLAKSRAKDRLAWRLEVDQALRGLREWTGEWRAVIDAIADGTEIRVYQLDLQSEAA